MAEIKQGEADRAHLAVPTADDKYSQTLLLQCKMVVGGKPELNSPLHSASPRVEKVEGKTRQETSCCSSSGEGRPLPSISPSFLFTVKQHRNHRDGSRLFCALRGLWSLTNVQPLLLIFFFFKVILPGQKPKSWKAGRHLVG